MIKYEDHDYSVSPVANKDKKGLLPMLLIMLGFTFHT